MIFARITRITRNARTGGETGSLMLAMLVGVVGVSVAALLAPIALNQIGSTRVDIRRVHALQAAQAGLDAATAQIRAADDGDGNGVRSRLPCGSVAGSGVGDGTAAYQVSIHYLAFDPRSQMRNSAEWFAANDLDCASGSGPSATPTFAVFFSTGTYSTGRRVLRGAYRLRTTNQNIAGGRIHVYLTEPTQLDLCMDAGSTTPAPGTNLQMRTCDTSQPAQLFAYTEDAALAAVGSVTAAQPTGLCLDTGAAPVEGALVKFQPCGSPAPPHQTWRFSEGARFRTMDAAGVTTDWFLELVSPNTSGSLVRIAKSPVVDGEAYTNVNSFGPEASIGPGDAGPRYKQFVNYNQFGRCLDLLYGDYATERMITWTCKPSWNQAFTGPLLATGMASAAPGTITMTAPENTPTPAGTYCLQSPRTTTSGMYVKMVPCTAGSNHPAMQWRIFGYTGDYVTSYRILDVDGNCLQPADLKTMWSDLEYNGAGAQGRIVVRPCNESTLQKWNAEPYQLEGVPLQYLGED